jgi:hypothetical protein
MLNNNGTHSEKTKQKLEYSMQCNDIDIMFLQEVANEGFQFMTWHAAHTNIGTEQRGIGTLKRDSTELRSMEKLPNGRSIAALCEQMLL